MRKQRIHSILIISSLATIVLFQVYWLADNWQRERANALAAAKAAFTETVYTTENNIINQLAGGTVKVFNQSGTVKIAPSSGTVVTFSKNRSQLPLSVFYDTLRPAKANSTTEFAIIAGKRISTIDSIRQTIPTNAIEQAIKKKLQKNYAAIQPIVTRINGIDSNLQEQQHAFVTIGSLSHVTFKLAINKLQTHLMLRMLLPFLLSLLITGIVTAALLLLHRTLKQQQQLLQRQALFISNVSHELSTPIATIQVALEATEHFSGQNNPQKTKEYMLIAGLQLAHLSSLVNTILTAASQTKKSIPPLSIVDINIVLKEAVDNIQPLAQQRKALINSNTTDAQINVWANKAELQTVFTNLLQNALKYNVQIPIIHMEVKIEGKEVIISIQDNGIGIPQEHLPYIFEQFYRVQQNDVHNYKGYGLGLFLVKEIIQRYKGTVDVYSEPEKGSVFIVQLPLYHGTN